MSQIWCLCLSRLKLLKTHHCAVWRLCTIKIYCENLKGYKIISYYSQLILSLTHLGCSEKNGFLTEAESSYGNHIRGKLYPGPKTVRMDKLNTIKISWLFFWSEFWLEIQLELWKNSAAVCSNEKILTGKDKFIKMLYRA